MKITVLGPVANIEAPYNPEFVRSIKAIGGARWNARGKMWSVPTACVDQVREIMRRVFGECDLPDETRRVNVKLHFNEGTRSADRKPLIIFGKQVAHAFSRDGGAVVGDGVSFLEGQPTSGGSRVNYCARIPAGAVALLRNVPENLLSEELPDGVTYEIMPDEAAPSREALLAEKERLLARLNEIDKLLA